jgi:hypothetical protein
MEMNLVEEMAVDNYYEFEIDQPSHISPGDLVYYGRGCT